MDNSCDRLDSAKKICILTNSGYVFAMDEVLSHPDIHID